MEEHMTKAERLNETLAMVLEHDADVWLSA